jgi:hypothetical protein
VFVFVSRFGKIMALYPDFLDDAKEMLADFGVAGSSNSGAITFLCLISDPMQTQVLEAGGYCDRTQFSVKVATATSSWTASDGRVGASTGLLVSGAPHSSLGFGKKIIAGSKTVRVNSVTYKPGSAWITLVVIDDNQ